jgi:hypothetical protein
VRDNLGAAAEHGRRLVKVPATDVRTNAHTSGFGNEGAHHAKFCALRFYAGVQNALGVIENEGYAFAALSRPDLQKLFAVVVEIAQLRPALFL